MFMFYFQYVQKRGEIMRSRISKTWPCHLKRAVLLSLLSGLFILPSQINAETSGEEYKNHQIAEADWNGAKAEQDFWSGKGIRNGSDYTFNKNTIISTELSKGNLVFIRQIRVSWINFMLLALWSGEAAKPELST